MIHDFYGLERDAFSLSPDLDFLYLSKEHEEAVAHLVYGLEQNEDIILIVGDIGTGKTMALHRVITQLSNVFVPVSINVTTMGFDQLLRLALLKLNADPKPEMDLAGLVDLFEKTLINSRDQGKKILLIIDEAQNLSLDVLESARLLMNLAQPGGQALQLVFSGQLGLDANINQPQMRQLRQRIRVEYQFGFLSRVEVEEYVLHRLKTAGGDNQLLDKGALDRVHQLSRGVPRVVNYLVSKAMLAGYVDGSKRISSRHFDDIPLDQLFDVVPSATARAQSTKRAESAEVVREEVSEGPAIAVAPPETRETTARADARGPGIASEAPPPASYVRRRHARPGIGAWAISILVLASVAAAFLYYPRWSSLLDPWLGETGERQTEMRLQPAGANSGVRPDEIAGEANGAMAMTDTTGHVAQDEPESPAPIQVAVEAEPDANDGPRTVASRTSETAALPAGYLLHVASFGQPERGAEFKAQLQQRGVESFVMPATLDLGKVWYRVYLGPFESREQARSSAVDMTEKGWITFSRITTPDPAWQSR